MAKHTFVFFVLLLLLGIQGCATREPVGSANDYLEVFQAGLQDPRRHWLTMYETKAGPVFAGANRIHPNHVASMEFTGYAHMFRKHELETAPIIEVQNREGDLIPALVDTLSRENWISFPSFRCFAGIPLGPGLHKKTATHLINPVDGCLTLLPKLCVDKLHMESAIVYTVMTNALPKRLGRSLDRPAPEVLLGIPFLQALRFAQFDFPNQSLHFSTTRPYSPSKDNLLATVPFDRHADRIAFDGMLDGEKTTVYLDVAGAYELTSDTYENEIVNQLTLGNFVLRRLRMANGKRTGLSIKNGCSLGRDALMRYVITLDMKRRVMHVEKPETEK